VKTQEEQMHTARESSHRSDGRLTSALNIPRWIKKPSARLAYFYWEERGWANDSPDEDWLRAEAELRNRLAAAATHK